MAKLMADGCRDHVIRIEILVVDVETGYIQYISNYIVTIDSQGISKRGSITEFMTPGCSICDWNCHRLSTHGNFPPLIPTYRSSTQTPASHNFVYRHPLPALPASRPSSVLPNNLRFRPVVLLLPSLPALFSVPSSLNLLKLLHLPLRTPALPLWAHTTLKELRSREFPLSAAKNSWPRPALPLRQHPSKRKNCNND